MRKYITALDGIRGFGIFFVLFYHYWRLNGDDSSVFGFSWIWIQMFFIQSGFLITTILLESRQQTFREYAREFYWRRILRIFPVYFAYILFFFFTAVIFNFPADFFQRLPYLLSFTYNYTLLIREMDFHSIWFTHFWSLAVEEQFYLVWPLLVYFLNPKSLRILIIAVVIATPVFRYWLTDALLASGYTPELTGDITYKFTISQFDAFAIGASIPLFNLPERIKKPIWGVIVLVTGAVIIGLLNFLSIRASIPGFSVTSLGISVGMIDNLQPVWSYTLINFLFLFVILSLIKDTYKGFFQLPWLVNIGKVVYGLYVFHLAILFMMILLNRNYIHNFYITFAIAFVLCYLAAYISYYYYEKRFLAWKDLWKTKT